MSNANTGMLSNSKSWADVGDDDFFAEVAKDKTSNKSSPTAGWGSRSAETKPAEKKATAGVPWAFPNPVQQGASQQQQQQQGAPQGSPASQSGGGGDRFGCFSPGSRRSAPLSAWRRN